MEFRRARAFKILLLLLNILHDSVHVDKSSDKIDDENNKNNFEKFHGQNIRPFEYDLAS
jgi:hypothetical protein